MSDACSWGMQLQRVNFEFAGDTCHACTGSYGLARAKGYGPGHTLCATLARISYVIYLHVLGMIGSDLRGELLWGYTGAGVSPLDPSTIERF